MRVVGVMEFGGPEALQVVEVPDPPAPGPGEVEVRVHAATVNPTDTYLRNGAYQARLRQPAPPYIPGMEAAGVVAAVGDGVTHVEVGDHVMTIVLPTREAGGAYAERIVVPAASVARSPRGASHAEAATIPMNGLTARLTLDRLGLEAGQTIAVTGAAGAYGGYVVELAKADGLRVRDGGGIASVRPFQADTERDITVHQIWVAEYAEARAELDRLRDLAEGGGLTMRIAQVYAADDAHEAHRRLEAGGTRGRLVIEL